MFLKENFEIFISANITQKGENLSEERKLEG